MHRQGWAISELGPLTVLVIGALLLFAGVTALLIGVSRAAEGLDYLVRQSR